jgi:hypothetical protein
VAGGPTDLHAERTAGGPGKPTYSSASRAAPSKKSAKKSGFSRKFPRCTAEASARAGLKTWNFSQNLESSLAPRQPTPNVVALAISALAAAVSIACAVSRARADREPVAVRQSVASPESGAELPVPRALDAR